MRPWWFLLIFAPLIAQGQITDTGKPLPTPEPNANSLFYLQRTKNTNTIIYELNRSADGEIEIDEPVKVYWRRFEDGDSITKELTFFERTVAFGVNTEKETDGFLVRLRAFKKRVIEIAKDRTGVFISQTLINGKLAQLERIYVESREGVFRPTILHVDLFGKDLLTGEEVRERVFPD